MALMDWWEVNLDREASFEEVRTSLNQLAQIQNNYECLVGENEQLQDSLRKQTYKNALLSEENKKSKKSSIIKLIFNKSEIGEHGLIRGNNEGVIHGSAINVSQSSKQLEVIHSDKKALFPTIVLRRLLNLARRKGQ